MTLVSGLGIQAERDLVHRFWSEGFAVLRAPASGGGTDLPRPDLIVGSVERQRFFVLEIKTIKRKVLYLQAEQIEGLIEFANRLGFEPVLGVKFKWQGKGFLFLKVPEQLEQVRDSANYKITLAEACRVGQSFGELIGAYRQEKVEDYLKEKE
ncbi:MAG: Holliday junction resolvase [Candidatus Heimdallarchaeota archaeon]|nr:Holliday junction resolvase [Candidatus Heimdallarchaeota archaeon]